MQRSVSYGSIERTPLSYQHDKQPPYNPSFSSPDECMLHTEDVPNSQICHVGHEKPCSISPVSNFGLIAALTMHAALEGLAVGLESSTSKVCCDYVVILK